MIKAVIFDYARTIVDMEVEPPALFPGTEDILQKLKEQGLKLALVSRGKDSELRRKEFITLGLNKFFEIFEVVGPEGTKDFTSIIKKLEMEATDCLVVGDRVRSEILQGNLIGATTVWIQRGKFSNELPENQQQQPNFTIKSLSGLFSILENIRS